MNRFLKTILILALPLAGRANPVNYTMTDGFSFSVTFGDFVPNIPDFPGYISASDFVSCRTAPGWACDHALFTKNYGPGLSAVALVSIYPPDRLMLPFSSQAVVQTDLGHAGVFESIYGNASLTITVLDIGASPTSVPEPGTWFLLGAGLIVVGAWRRSRSPKSAESIS